MPILLKIITYEWGSDSRDQRELLLAKSLGAEVHILAKGPDGGRYTDRDGFLVHTLSTKPLGEKAPGPVNGAVNLLRWAKAARVLRPEIISGHDLKGLLPGYLAARMTPKKRRPKLVYDAHEFEPGREPGAGGLNTRLKGMAERFLMNRCAFSITVNDSIAEELTRLYRLKRRPLVVRSTPERQTLNPEAVRRTREEFLTALGLPEDTFLVMYHGAVFPGRGVENLLRAVAATKGTGGIVLGNGEPAYLSELHAMAEKLGVQNRVLFHPAVPHETLFQYVAAANAGTVLLLPVARNHVYTLPNKFFENIQAETPVIVSDFPEVGGLTKRYAIGLAVNPEDPTAIAHAVEKLRDDSAFYAGCKAKLRIAKGELCWEKEKQTLEAAYRVLLEERT